MSYHCGTQGLTGLGIPDGEPRITCDTCGVIKRLPSDRVPPAWFMNGKAAPGWSLSRTANGGRIDTCPECRKRETKS